MTNLHGLGSGTGGQPQLEGPKSPHSFSAQTVGKDDFLLEGCESRKDGGGAPWPVCGEPVLEIKENRSLVTSFGNLDPDQPDAICKPGHPR